MKRKITALLIALMLVSGTAYAALQPGELKRLLANGTYNILASTIATLTSTTAALTTATMTTATVTGTLTASGALVAPGEVVAATNILTSAECGKTMTLAHATEFVSTLPAPSLGCRFKFIVGLAPASASYTIVTTSSANIIYGGVTSNEIDDATDSNSTATDGSDVITLVDGQAVKGDWVEVWSDGTSWYVNGNSKVRAGITFGQT